MLDLLPEKTQLWNNKGSFKNHASLKCVLLVSMRTLLKIYILTCSILPLTHLTTVFFVFWFFFKVQVLNRTTIHLFIHHIQTSYKRM